METQQEEARAAASRSVLSGLAPALAQAYVLNYVPENVAQMLAECFPSVDSVRYGKRLAMPTPNARKVWLLIFWLHH